MEDHHPEISEDHVLVFGREEVIVDDFESAGLILDIGGGGEGVIGRLKGTQVVAIDSRKQELEEAPAGPLKVVMDAADLHFLDESFSTVTSFYTLMYVKDAETLGRVFGEAHRVLTAGGRFFIWDAILPRREDNRKDVVAVLLAVKLGEEVVETGYGVSWPDERRDSSYYVNLARNAGFEVVSQKEEGRRLFLEARKR